MSSGTYYWGRPIRFNNFAYAIRELTSHILARLAPDEEVLNSKWYKNETDIDKGVSRKQRIYYAIHGGLLPTYVQSTLNIDVAEFYRKFRDIVNRLSKYTHIEPETFGLDDKNVTVFADQTLETLVELFTFIDNTREILAKALYERAEIALIDVLLEQTFSEIDILATHHSLEYVHTETLDLIQIDHQFINFDAIGTVEYRMQWGSDLDVSKGNGVVFHESFPFKCKINSSVLDLSEMLVDIGSIEVETDEDT